MNMFILHHGLHHKVIKSGYSPKLEPTLELHSRAAPSVGGKSPLHRSQHRKKFRRKADNKKIEAFTLLLNF